MIKRVTIKNFQSHKDSTFEFCPTTNAIIGSSNNGKTVVLRAISWVVTNRPSADSIISHWAKDEKGNQIDDTIVTIETDNHIISRIKTKKTNTYVVDGKTLDAIGRDVPKEVSDALCMEEVNIQKQMDAPFLLADSPGEVARFFNKLIKLDKIDVYLSSIESKKRKTRDTLNLTADNKGKTEEELKNYLWTDKALGIIGTLKVLTTEERALYDSIVILKRQIAEIQEVEQTIETLNKVISKALELATEIDKILISQIKVTEQKDRLTSTIETYTKNTSLYEEVDKLLTASIPLIINVNDLVQCDVTPTINSLMGSIQEYKQHEKIINLDVDIFYTEKLIDKLGRLQDIAKKELAPYTFLAEQITTLKTLNNDNTDKEIKELEDSLPPFCPTCGGPIHV